ncbi:DUF4260 family protein [Natronosalvus amylolyticus]|uniref:DUF4260 family protein n=1 Tax=Natronosalvus amylolyticus TaxID=2961994 RepID=UPI0020C96D12
MKKTGSSGQRSPAGTYTLLLALGSLSFWADIRRALFIALIWAGHIGADRHMGYGLKSEPGFKNTHFSTQPAPVEAFTKSDNDRSALLTRWKF